jgi:hypothetical protein
MHKLMMQCPYFLLSTISSLMHDIVYSLTCSETSKGLSLRELICAFCIIIFASYRTSLYYYLHHLFIIPAFLDDFWDFFTRFPPRYLISERQKISCFVFCYFRDLLDLNLIGNFYSVNILPWEASGEVVPHEGSHEAQTGMGGMAYQADRATRAHLPLDCHLTSVFLCTPSFW